MNDPTNITGISFLLNDEFIDSNINKEKIEKNIINNTNSISFDDEYDP
jgi:hypothetical protein